MSVEESTSEQGMEFDLSFREFPLKLSGKKYIIREANGTAATKYRNALIAGARLKDSKVEGLEGVAKVEPLLVSECVFELDNKGKPMDTHVPLATVIAWPSRVIKPVFNKIKEISDLDEKPEDEDKVKNESNSTEDGSK